MGGAGEGNPVADDIRPVCLDRADMRRFDLCPAAAVDQLEPRDRTALVIGPENDPAENPVPNDARGEITDPVAVLLELQGCPLFLHDRGTTAVADADRKGVGKGKSVSG